MFRLQISSKLRWNPGRPNAAAQFPLSTSYQVTKTSWLFVPVLIATLCSGKNQEVIKIAHNY